MNLGFNYSYLIIINITSFILYCINMLLYNYTENGQIDKLLTLTSLLGGSLGIIFAILLFDRKFVKDIMMSRVFVICMFIIQLIVFISFKFNIIDGFTLRIWKLFERYQILLIYLGIINFITFTIFALDKMKAITGQWRYKIVTLLGLCFIGGSVGGLLSMYIFKHKTSVDYFTVGIPIIMVMQLFIVIFLANII